MTLLSYAGGITAVAAVVVVLGYGSWALRTRLVPVWRGAPARLAEIVIGVTALFTTAQLLGAVHWFSRGPVLAGELTAGAVLTVVARAGASRAIAAPTPTRQVDRRELVAAGAGVVLVLLQWTTHVAYAFSEGMTYSDTMWYHQPFAARFVQHHSFDTLQGVGLDAARLYPLNSPLLHALGMLAFGNDLLSPLLNLGWALVALLAAWCIGAHRGVGHISTLGAAVAIGLPILTATQPGQASSDIAAIALFLAAIALLVEGGFAPAPTALAGLALGLAVSTKITVVAPAAVLAAGGVLLAWQASRRAAVWWVAAIAGTGSFWFVRNWWLFGSPVPWFDLHLGPFHLPVRPSAAAVASGQPSLFTGLRSGVDALPRAFYLDGLTNSFGRVWPVPFVVLAVAVGLLVVRGRDALTRVVGMALGAGAIAYVFTPYTGRLNFGSGLRFLAPLVLVAFVLVPARSSESTRWRRAEIAVLLGLTIVNATAPALERIPAWPSSSIVPALLVVMIAAAVGVAATRVRPEELVAAVAVLVIAGGGWVVQRQYFDHRYVHAGLPNDSLDAFFRDVHDSRVAVAGTDDTYPMFGADLSNDVRRVDDPPFDLSGDQCEAWRKQLAGDDYVAVAGSPVAFGIYPLPPAAVFADPAATEVMRDQYNVVYRLTGTLDPSSS